MSLTKRPAKTGGRARDNGPEPRDRHPVERVRRLRPRGAGPKRASAPFSAVSLGPGSPPRGPTALPRPLLLARTSPSAQTWTVEKSAMSCQGTASPGPSSAAPRPPDLHLNFPAWFLRLPVLSLSSLDLDHVPQLQPSAPPFRRPPTRTLIRSQAPRCSQNVAISRWRAREPRGTARPLEIASEAASGFLKRKNGTERRGKERARQDSNL